MDILKANCNILINKTRTISAIEKSIRRNLAHSKNVVQKERNLAQASYMQSMKAHTRNSARALHLVRAFIKGTPYHMVEGKDTRIDPTRGSTVLRVLINEWLQEGKTNKSLKEFEKWQYTKR